MTYFDVAPAAVLGRLIHNLLLHTDLMTGALTIFFFLSSVSLSTPIISYLKLIGHEIVYQFACAVPGRPEFKWDLSVLHPS